jgi:hypothetical protein
VLFEYVGVLLYVYVLEGLCALVHEGCKQRIPFAHVLMLEGKVVVGQV